jgi:ABC-type microcin C transport system permease subunit YejE
MVAYRKLQSWAKLKHTKKITFYFLFILVRTTSKSIQFINKPVFLFWFFPCCCFAFISKAATAKNHHFIYIRSQYAMLGSWSKLETYQNSPNAFKINITFKLSSYPWKSVEKWPTFFKNSSPKQNNIK